MGAGVPSYSLHSHVLGIVTELHPQSTLQAVACRHGVSAISLGTLAHKSAEYKKGILGINLENISSIVD